MNHPSRGPIFPRERRLQGDEVVYGEYLSLAYCNHDPFVRLIDHDTLAALEAAILGAGGILNPYINYLVAFISGKAAKYEVTYEGEDGTVLRFDKYGQPWSFDWKRAALAQYPNAAIKWL